MSELKIIIAPDPRLKKKAEPIKEVSKEILKTIDDMVECMYENKGIGLAATQVGILKRIIVIDTTQKKDEEGVVTRGKVHKMINPEIIWKSKEKNTYEEGCLSLPQQYADVTRSEKVKVKYLDENSKEQIIEVDGLFATCVQHEIDHLNGIIFVDHISKIKKAMILKKLKKHYK